MERQEAVDVLRFALAAYASSAAGGVGVDPASLSEAAPGRRCLAQGQASSPARAIRASGGVRPTPTVKIITR